MPLSRDLDVSTFSCGHDDLDEFLIEDSMDYQRERLSVTRLAYIDSEIVGFFTLVTDCIDVKQVDPENGRRGYPYRKYPAIKVASNCRWTDNGRIITTAGVSAGIDGALRVISKLISPDCARRTAQFIEYPYHESDFNA